MEYENKKSNPIENARHMFKLTFNFPKTFG
jgi:hypothetical protein